MINFHILDNQRKKVFEELSCISQEGFYLAGGTALALLIGHRDSIDFDFFRQGDFDTVAFHKKLEQMYGVRLLKVQEEKNTLGYILDNTIKLSFFGYQYPLVSELVTETPVPLANILDIGCMKLSAITSRATNKDYIDLYYIFKQISFESLLELCRQKLPSLDPLLIKKSLVYFDDIIFEPIMYKDGFEVDFEEIKKSLRSMVC
jgi:hypothetical protein